MSRDIILAIETVASPASVCLFGDDEVIDEMFISEPNQVSSQLSKYINILINNNLNTSYEIDKIAVSQGPGSFTGLRAGMAAAKGMTFALKKPLIGINTHFAMYQAFKANNKDYINYDYFVPLIDARKDKAFASLIDKQGNIIEESQLINLKEDNFINQLNDSTVLLPLNNEFSTFLLEYDFNIETIELTSSHIAKFSGDNEVDYDEQESAYLEPIYVVNNYVKK